MRVFVAGGTGAIGRPLVARLLEHGHHVTVLTRSEQRAEKIRAGGSEAVVGDVLATGSLVGLLGASHPDIVVNQLTSLARTAARRDLHRGLADTARLRTEASASIMAAAAGAGVRRVVAQSIAFVYRPGPGTRTEDDPLYLDGPAQLTQVAGPVTRLESETLGSDTVDGVVLRYGAFYGPGTYYAPDGAFAEMVRRRRLPVVGRGRGAFGFVHIDDAAAATVAALTGPPGTYNVVDDHPAPAAQWVPHLARLLGAPPPRHVPAPLGRLVAGSYPAYLFDEQPPVANRRAGEQLGWRPGHPDWREGFAATFG
jgi:nucleoside-diphosphate-sugar epimerase